MNNVNIFDDRRNERYYWETQDGRFIAIDDLDDKHLINIVIKFGKDYLSLCGYNRIIEKFNNLRKQSNFYV